MKVGSESRDRAEIVEREEGEKRVTKMTKTGTAKARRREGLGEELKSLSQRHPPPAEKFKSQKRYTAETLRRKEKQRIWENIILEQLVNRIAA